MFTHDLTTESCLLGATKRRLRVKTRGDQKAGAYCGMFIAGYVVFQRLCVRALMSKHSHVASHLRWGVGGLDGRLPNVLTRSSMTHKTAEVDLF